MSTAINQPLNSQGKPSDQSMERAADRSKAADDAEQDSGKTNWSRRGRKKGSGSYDKLDAPLLDEMHELIKNGDAVSINDAAGQVASKAKGSSTESKITRLSTAVRLTERCWL